MNSETIRGLIQTLTSDKIEVALANPGLSSGCFDALMKLEIAAQLAEINEQLKDINNSLPLQG